MTMKKKHTLVFMALALSGASAFAQAPGPLTVEGTVVDSLTQSPEPYATLRLLRPGEKQAFKALTADANGHFRLELPKAGRYTLECAVLGKQTLRREVVADGRTSVSLGTLRMQDITGALATATVTAARPLVKTEIDKIAYSLAEDPDAKTSTLLDMLRKVPLVTVDGEDEIKVKGSTGFKVYVNGKPNQMMSAKPADIFKVFPASAVKKIEVITDPGAKYDAEGLTGILNIVTEENAKTDGYTFSPTIGLTNRGMHGGLFGMVQAGKFTLSANYSAGHSTQPDCSITQERESFADAENHLFRENGSVADNSGTWHFGSLEASYELDKHNLFSLSAGIMSYKGDFLYSSQSLMTQADGTRRYGYAHRMEGKIDNPSFNLGFDYQHSFGKEGQMLTLSYRLDNSPTRDTRRSTYSFAPDEVLPFELADLSNFDKKRFTEQTGQVDFTSPLGKIHELSFGAKYINRQNRSTALEQQRPSGSDADFATNDENSVRYRHQTDIVAGYAEYKLKLEKLSARIGTRYEYSHVRASYPGRAAAGFTKSLSDLVPNVSLGYSLSQLHMLKCSYSMRVGRPGINYLSPYVQHNNPTELSYGNPALESERYHSLSLDFSSFTPKLMVNASLGYGWSNNGTMEYQFMKEGVLHKTFENMLHQKNLTLSAFVNWNLTQTTSLNLNGSARYDNFRCYRTGDHNYGASANAFLGLKQLLPWGLKANVMGGYNSGAVQAQGKGTSNFFHLLTLSRSFLPEDRLTVTLQGVNFIHPRQKFTTRVETEAFRSVQTMRIEPYRIGVSLTYRIGKLQTQVKKAQRSIQNDDVMKGNSSSAPGGNPTPAQ